MKYETCQVDGCERTPRSGRAEYCEMHYYRLRRTGSTSDPIRLRGECLANNCEAPAQFSGGGHHTASRGYCRMHYLRLKKRGDVNFECKGENNPMWSGDDATNKGVHQRIRKARGRARDYDCGDCGEPAKHWSYDHADPNEKHDPVYGPYSTDIDRYAPRCVPCHKRFDLSLLRQRRSG